MYLKLLTIAISLTLIFLSGCEEKDNSVEINEASEVIYDSEYISISEPDEPNKDAVQQDFSDISTYPGEIDESITRIAQAYLENNPKLLSDQKEIAVFKECKIIINRLITDDMSDYEKELAIHDYIITNAQYDLDELNTFKTVSEDSFTPYGLLIKGKGICLAYTQTFQLFMDMLEIDCITVHSTAYDGEEHAWNMVRLDGYWYHVDVTWDDPIPNRDYPTYTYFNVTDELMAQQHQWDRDNFPKAESKAHIYAAMSAATSGN